MFHAPKTSFTKAAAAAVLLAVNWPAQPAAALAIFRPLERQRKIGFGGAAADV